MAIYKSKEQLLVEAAHSIHFRDRAHIFRMILKTWQDLYENEFDIYSEDHYYELNRENLMEDAFHKLYPIGGD